MNKCIEVSLPGRSQSGFALFLGLIVLLVLTVLGLTSSNVSMMQERMARNVQDTNVAFQRAEGILRDIEGRIRTISEQGGSGGLPTIPTWADLGLQRGDCTLARSAMPGWRNSLAANIPGEYIVVDLGALPGVDDIPIPSGCTPMSEQPTPLGEYYLIIARAPGRDANTVAQVQSIFYYP